MFWNGITASDGFSGSDGTVLGGSAAAPERALAATRITAAVKR
jgi:hypothetical protein